MLGHTKKRHTEMAEARFIGTPESIRRLRELAKEAGATDVSDSIPWRDAFPEFKENEVGTLLSGYRSREGMTQTELSRLTGIPQRHISEMEHGKRIIGKETARKLAKALNADYRSFL